MFFGDAKCFASFRLDCESFFKTAIQNCIYIMIDYTVIS